MPRRGTTRQYQSHTLKLRHWLLEVRIHHFPRRGAACRPRPSCCSPGTRLCPLQGDRAGVRGAGPAGLPCPSPAQAAKAAKKILLPPKFPSIPLICPTFPERLIELRLWNSSTQPGELNCDTAQRLFYVYWTDQPVVFFLF